MSARGRAVLGCLLLALAGSGAHQARAQTPGTLDPERVPRLRVTELARIGGYDDREAYTFSSIPGGAVLSDGTVALTDRFSREIRVFDTAGRHLRSFGREGEGPGEFKYLRAIQAISGDRIAAWDLEAKRLVTFRYDGTHISTKPISMEDMGILWADLVGFFPDGSAVLRHDPNVMALKNAPQGLRREPTSFVRYSPAGEVLDTVAVHLGPEKMLYRQDSNWGLEDRLFERKTLGAVVGDVLLTGSSEGGEFARWSAGDGPLPPLVLDRPERRVNTREIERERDRLMEEVRAEEERRSGRSMGGLGAAVSFADLKLDRLSKVGSYGTLPAFRSMRAGGRQALWLEDYPRPSDSTRRWFLVQDGAVSGWIELQAGDEFLAAGEGILLTRVEDEFGVQTVVIHRVEDAGR